jgi:hypothetical protein
VSEWVLVLLVEGWRGWSWGAIGSRGICLFVCLAARGEFFSLYIKKTVYKVSQTSYASTIAFRTYVRGKLPTHTDH